MPCSGSRGRSVGHPCVAESLALPQLRRGEHRRRGVDRMRQAEALRDAGSDPDGPVGARVRRCRRRASCSRAARLRPRPRSTRCACTSASPKPGASGSRSAATTWRSPRARALPRAARAARARRLGRGDGLEPAEDASPPCLVVAVPGHRPLETVGERRPCSPPRQPLELLGRPDVAVDLAGALGDVLLGRARIADGVEDEIGDRRRP